VTSAALVILLAQVAGAASGRVVVESATTCPTAAEVEDRLRVLLPPLAGGAAAERATLAAEDGALRVRLTGADGATLAERTVTVTASCADRANVVAVVIAAWDLQQRAERVDDPTFPRAPAPPAPPAVVVASPPPPRTPGPRLELAFAPGLALADGIASPSGTLTASLWGRRFGGRFGVFGLLPHSDGIADGSARWTRFGATFEVAARAAGRLGRLDGHAGIVTGAVIASGAGFALDETTGSLSPGALVGADWSYLFGHVFAGAGASLSLYPTQRLVFSADSPVSRTLPHLQPTVDLVVGVLF
jgi:hypothetical protein